MAWLWLRARKRVEITVSIFKQPEFRPNDMEYLCKWIFLSHKLSVNICIHKFFHKNLDSRNIIISMDCEFFCYVILYYL